MKTKQKLLIFYFAFLMSILPSCITVHESASTKPKMSFADATNSIKEAIKDTNERYGSKIVTDVAISEKGITLFHNDNTKSYLAFNDIKDPFVWEDNTFNQKFFRVVLHGTVWSFQDLIQFNNSKSARMFADALYYLKHTNIKEEREKEREDSLRLIRKTTITTAGAPAVGVVRAASMPLPDPASREALTNALRQTSYSAPDSIARRLVEFNVLRYAFLHPNTGDITLVGSYDPSYPSGPIPYYDLLADALQNPYPSFSIKCDLDDPALHRIQQTIDEEMSHAARDVNYGIAWMNRLISAALDPQSGSEDRLLLDQRLRKLGIPPDVFRAYMAWDKESGLDNPEFRQKMGLFFAKVLAGVGIDERVGYGIIALKDWVNTAVGIKQGRAPADGEQPFDKTIRLFKYLGIESELFRLREEIAANRIQESRETIEVLACVYGGLLRGLQIPESEVSSLVEGYRAGRIPERVLTDKYNARYLELARRSLIQNIFNGFCFSGALLSQMYSFTPVMSGVNLFGSRPDSPIMRVFFDGDYTLKCIASAKATAKSVPGDMSFVEYLSTAAGRSGASAGRLPVQGVQRYWIFPGKVQMDGFSDGSGVRFVSANVRIGAEQLKEPRGSDSQGTEFYRRTLHQYGEQLTNQYDAYARVYPSLHVIRETEKVIALARWIKSLRTPVRVPEAKPARTPVPQRVEGFWGLTYIVRPTGMTDDIYLWVQGGVSFDQQQGDGWIQVTPNVTATSDVLHQLAASTALAEKAAAEAIKGNLEKAHQLAEKSAQAMTGLIDKSVLPDAVPTPAGPVTPAGSVAVSQAALAALENNMNALKSTPKAPRRAEPPAGVSSPVPSDDVRARAEENLRTLQNLLAEYRRSAARANEIVLDIQRLGQVSGPMVARKKVEPSPEKGDTEAVPAAEKLIHEGVLSPLKPAPKPPTIGKVDSQEAASMEGQRAKLQGELAALREQMQGVRESLDRFNRAMQNDVAQMQEWQKTVDHSMTDLFKRSLSSLLVDIPLMKMTSLYKQLGDIDKKLQGKFDWAAVDPQSKKDIQEILKYNHKIRDGVQETAQRIKELNEAKATFGLDKLVNEESTSKKVKDGVLQLSSILANTEKSTKMLNEAVSKVPNLAASQRGISYPLSYYIYCGNLIVDNILDITTMVVGWRETNRILYGNMDAYSKAIKGLSKRNEQIVKKIKEKEAQLAKLQISE